MQRTDQKGETKGHESSNKTGGMRRQMEGSYTVTSVKSVSSQMYFHSTQCVCLILWFKEGAL